MVARLSRNRVDALLQPAGGDGSLLGQQGLGQFDAEQVACALSEPPLSHLPVELLQRVAFPQRPATAQLELGKPQRPGAGG